MSNTTLKIIACVSMLLDHIGYILFPEYIIFRYFGRIAMPIFAFFIGVGCRYTKNKLKYFSQVLLLGVFCQIVYVANDLITGNFDKIYGNILLTFSLSIIICFAFLYFEDAIKTKQKSKIIKTGSLFLACVLGVFLFYALPIMLLVFLFRLTMVGEAFYCHFALVFSLKNHNSLFYSQ